MFHLFRMFYIYIETDLVTFPSIEYYVQYLEFENANLLVRIKDKVYDHWTIFLPDLGVNHLKDTGTYHSTVKPCGIWMNKFDPILELFHQFILSLFTCWIVTQNKFLVQEHKFWQTSLWGTDQERHTRQFLHFNNIFNLFRHSFLQMMSPRKWVSHSGWL